MQILAELKRRNVLRIAAAYLAVAWLLIEVTGTIIPLFGFGDTPTRILVIVLAIGFIPALVFAWAFELTHEGLKFESEVNREHSITAQTGSRLDRVVMFVLALALSVFAFDKFMLDPARDAAEFEAIRAEAIEQSNSAVLSRNIPENSIAVLPFVDLSSENDQQYFGDGMAEELLNILAGIRSLKVAGRTSSFAFKGRNEDLRKIGQALGVATILEGSVRKDGNTIRVTAQLINADDGFHVWSATYDRELSSVFAVQDEISRAIVEALQVELATADSSRLNRTEVPTENMKAYERYLEGRGLFFERKDDSVLQGIRLLNEAVTLDPEFAGAWGFLAMAYAQRFEQTLSEAAAQRALTLDNQSANAFTAQAHWAMAWNVYWEISERPSIGSRLGRQAELFKKALEIDPSNPTALLWSGIHHIVAGQYDKAAGTFEQAMVIDPLVGINWGWLGLARLAQERREEGRELLRKALDEFNWSPAMMWLIEDSIEQQELDTARALIAEARRGALGFSEVARYLDEALAYLDAVDAGTQKQYLRRHSPELARDSHLGFIGPRLLVEGMHDFAFEHFSVVLRMGRVFEPWHGAFREDPRFIEKMHEGEYPMFWRAHGFPNVCRAAGDDSFVCD